MAPLPKPLPHFPHFHPLRNNQLFTSLFKSTPGVKKFYSLHCMHSFKATTKNQLSLIMANYFSKNSINVAFLFLIIFSSLHFLSVYSFEFEVGGTHGWVVPPVNDSKTYNDWASENRFQVGDTIRFKYKKDSVMEVTNEDYKKCNSTHPIFFSNTGDSVFRLERSGAFYFISGVSGHCEKGQRMIVKVMSSEDSSPSTDHGHKSSSAAEPAAVLALRVSKLATVQFILLCTLASYLY